MATQVRPRTAAEYDQLIKIYRKAEQDILAEISYKRYMDQVTYAQEAALDRVQIILQELLAKARGLIPPLITKQYLMGKRQNGGLGTIASLTSYDYSIVDNLVHELMGELTQANMTATTILQETWQDSLRIARLEEDPYRTEVLKALAEGEATGKGIQQAEAIFLEKMKRQGIVGFVTKKGAKWSIRTYANMAIRTTSRQATNVGNVMADPDHDLYQISTHNTTCNICAPLEGRVFSRSGTNPNYPPLALAFGKIDPAGPDTLENSWLNIHPNCLHVILKYYEEGKAVDEIEAIREFSSLERNPVSIDPRPAEEVKRYREQQRGRQKLLDAAEQFERYKIILGDQMPKTFQTFLKHKVTDSEKYQNWKRKYREMNKNLKNLT